MYIDDNAYTGCSKQVRRGWMNLNSGSVEIGLYEPKQQDATNNRSCQIHLY